MLGFCLKIFEAKHHSKQVKKIIKVLGLLAPIVLKEEQLAKMLKLLDILEAAVLLQAAMVSFQGSQCGERRRSGASFASRG